MTGLHDDKGSRGTKRSRNSGNNFFTVSDVEKRMKRALSVESGRSRGASDETWKQSVRINPSVSTKGDNCGNRTMYGFTEGGHKWGSRVG